MAFDIMVITITQGGKFTQVNHAYMCDITPNDIYHNHAYMYDIPPNDIYHNHAYMYDIPPTLVHEYLGQGQAYQHRCMPY